MALTGSASTVCCTRGCSRPEGEVAMAASSPAGRCGSSRQRKKACSVANSRKREAMCSTWPLNSRGAVGGQRLGGLVRRRRRGVYAVSALPALGHLPAEEPAAEDHAPQVDVEDLLPFLGGGVEEGAGQADAGVVDQDVHHAVLGSEHPSAAQCRTPPRSNELAPRDRTNAMWSPDQAKGRWNQPRTARSRGKDRCARAASRPVEPGRNRSATATHSYDGRWTRWNRWTRRNRCGSAESPYLTAVVMPPHHLSTPAARRSRCVPVT